MITPVAEHIQAVALKLASGERSRHRIALDLGLGIEYVEIITALPQTKEAVAKIAPEAIPVERSITQRLEDLSQDALDIVETKMRTGLHERTVLAAAKVILDARQAGRQDKGRGAIFILSDGEAERMRETIFQIRNGARHDRDGNQVGDSPTGTPAGVPGELVLSHSSGPRVQGPSSTRTSPLLPISHKLLETEEAQ